MTRLRLLDTDAVSEWQRHSEAIEGYIRAIPTEWRATTAITVEEKLRGRLAFLARATDPLRAVPAYRYLVEEVSWFATIRVLPFTEAAANRFRKLRATGIRLGTLDLRIACIALTVGGVVATRNVRDFSRVPGVDFEDWSQPMPR